jgi:stearoyl-CoA desaturase (delta-9 desaturase)
MYIINIMMLTAKNLFLIQLIAHILALAWILSLPPLTDILLVFLVYFFTGCIGMSITYHRLLTHRSFKTNKFFEYFGTLCATVGLTGSSIAWTAAHRSHHANADKNGDPHSPMMFGYFRSQFLSMFSPINIKKSPVVTDKVHQFFHKYYLHINLVWAIILFLIGGVWAVLTLYIVPAVLLWNAGSLINTVCHTKYLGYRRYNVPDNSVNNPILGLLMWGEGWHNNHHRFQSRPNIGERWYEIDIGYYLIKILKNI